MKKIIAAVLACMLIMVSLAGCTASGQRTLKSLSSNWSGGLNRTVTVYDYTGNVLGQWSGKFDVSESENETFFDVDGKRVIIQGGIIVNEES